MTVEEALAASVVEPVNDIFEINPETRVITVPASEKLFGVANDGNTERKHFRCPKVVGNNIDLSTMHLYINYQNANGDKYPYLVEDVQTDGDYITFSWLIGPDVVAYKGQVKFIVCAKKGDGTISEWNTTLAEGTVLEGLEAEDEVVERNPDIITQLLNRMREAEILLVSNPDIPVGQIGERCGFSSPAVFQVVFPAPSPVPSPAGPDCLLRAPAPLAASLPVRRCCQAVHQSCRAENCRSPAPGK